MKQLSPMNAPTLRGLAASAFFVTLLSLGITPQARATLITANLYEMKLTGNFGSSIDPNISNLPDSTYPFAQMRGGSFEGTFVYDSMARLDNSFEGRFPCVSVNITIRDNTGAIAKTCTTSPNNFYVTPTGLQLTFGPSVGIPNSIEDLRLFLTGSFTRALPPPPPELTDWGLLSIWVVPPPPSEITAGVVNFGFLETDGTRAFTSWDLPVTSATISLSRATPYLREIPDGGHTIGLLGLGLMSLFGVARRWGVPKRSGPRKISTVRLDQ